MNGLREGLENRMEISLVARRSGKDTYVIYGKLGDGERLAVSETASIELMDGSSVVREVLELRALVDGKYANVRACTGPCPFGVEVSDLEGYDVKTPDAVEARRRIKRFDQMVCLTPFRELKHGDESIYDWVEDGYAVPKKVLAYLMTTEPFFMSHRHIRASVQAWQTPAWSLLLHGRTLLVGPRLLEVHDKVSRQASTGIRGLRDVGQGRQVLEVAFPQSLFMVQQD